MPQKGRPIRILVVENNSKDFKLLQKSLTTAAIKRAETVDQAVETLADQNFDLIFLHLPVADNSGLQAFEKLRNKSGNTSVIICCDKNNLELARQMIHEGAQEYVLKEKIDQDTLSRIVYCSMERAQYHERIRKSEEFYRGGSDAEQKRTAEKLHFQSAVLENITDGVFITDADNKVVFWNKACVEIFGYPENEMIGKEPSVLSVDSNDGTDMSNIVRRMDTYGSFNAVVRRRTNEGRIIWIDLKVTYNYDADRTKTGMIFVTRDVTDIQDEEHLLKLFQSVILNTNDAVVIIDATSSPKEAAQKIVFVNEAFRQTTGYRPDEIIGKTLFTLSGPLTDEKEMRRIHEAMLRWESFEGELLYYRKDSSTFWVNITLMPVSDQSGRFTHWVFILRNITEEKNADEQLRDQNDALTKTNRELDRFVYSASHDLRAPLTSVLGLVSLMRRESFGEDAGIYLDKIHESIHRLDRLIQNIINYSRNSRLAPESVEIHFGKIFDTTVAMHKFMDNTVKMMFKYSSKLSDPYLSDPDRWQIILNNLVSNSIKFARVHADSYIHLDVAKVSDELVVTFEDNGIGIPAAQLDSIFEMFYRATDASAGSGLGLYIVRQTVELLGGSITVDSKTGVFTRFTIRMPFVNNAPQIYAEKSYRTA